MAQITIIKGPDKSSRFDFNEEAPMTIGRNTENDIVLNDMSASRKHAQLEFRNSHYYIRDLNSTHGTVLNDTHVHTEMMLSHQDIVRIGGTELLFHTEPIHDHPTQPVYTAFALKDDSQPKQTLDEMAVDMTIPAYSMDDMGTMVESGGAEAQLHILARVAETIRTVFDLKELLDSLMEMVFEVFKPDRGVIMLYEDGEGSELTPQVIRNQQGGEQVKVSRTIVNHAIESRMSLLVSDTQEDQRFNAAESIMANEILSAICSPLVCKNKVLGVLYIDTYSHVMTYSKGDLELLNSIAAQAAIAIENATLVREKVEAERLAAIGVAIAGISHYVKNILAGVVGSEGLIDMGLNTLNIDLIKDSWPIMKRSNKKINTLIQDMLTYSKKREPEWAPGDLNRMLKEVSEQQEDRAKQHSVTLMIAEDHELPEIMYDHNAMYDVILNIVGNAIEACNEIDGARVLLKTEFQAESKTILVEIADNGPGIPDEIQEKIFMPFFSTKGSRGTGLGLAVARKVIEEHRGKLLLESEVGKGTTFRITVPVLTKDDL